MLWWLWLEAQEKCQLARLQVRGIEGEMEDLDERLKLLLLHRHLHGNEDVIKTRRQAAAETLVRTPLHPPLHRRVIEPPLLSLDPLNFPLRRGALPSHKNIPEEAPCESPALGVSGQPLADCALE